MIENYDDLDPEARERIAEYEQRLLELDREQQRLLDAISETVEQAAQPAQ